ncbi:hypothetical protein Q0N99_16800 [Bacillus siamensis]
MQDVQLSVLVPDKADPHQKGGRNAAFFFRLCGLDAPPYFF